MKDMKTIDLNLLPIETLKEMANEAGEQVENNAKQTVQKAADCGRYLIAIKDQCEPGKWLEWLGANWNYTRRTATRYMEIAEHGTRMSHLKDASSINEALRMIADDKEEKTAPRSERKPADVVVSKPAESREFQDEPDIDVPFSPPDDDPTPDPPTIRKTAKGSEKGKEAAKPQTQQVTVEIVEESDEDGAVVLRESDSDGIRELFRRCVVPDEGDLRHIIEALIRKTENNHGQKKLAAVLRKWGNELDPPAKFVKPDGSDVLGYLAVYATDKKFIAEHGVRTEEQLETAADGFIDHYASNGWMVGKVKMSDWRATARKWLKNQGQFANGKANGNGHSTAHRGTTKRRPTVEEVFG